MRASRLALVSALVLVPLGTSWGADVSLDSLKREHPRVLATAADFAAIPARCQTNPDVARWLAALRDEADGLLTRPLLKYEKPDGRRLLSVSREATRRMQTLGLIYQLDKDPKYLERASRELENVCGFPDWNPSHFLDVGEMTHACAIGYDWFHAGLSDRQRRVVREAIVAKGLQPALKVYRGKGGWAKAVHNWNQVCNGGITLGALAIADEEPRLAQEVLTAAVASVQLALAEYPPDGGYKEGPGYWVYGTTFQVLMIAGLESALGDDQGLAGKPGLDITGWFPLQMTGPTGKYFNYADASEGAKAPACLLWLGRKFQQPLFVALASRDARPEPLDLLWAPDSPVTVSWDAVPRAAYFRGVEAVALRGAWNDPETTFVGFKAGSPSFNHAQMDVGSFVLDALGQRWALDLGADDYNLPGYFDTKDGRWNFYRNRAEGHNTLVFPDAPGQDQEREPVAKIRKFVGEGTRPYAIADLTPTYSRHASKSLRGIALDQGRDVLVQDEIEARGEALLWQMHTRASVQFAPDGRSATLQQQGKTLTASLIGEPTARFTVRPAQPLEGSPKVPGQKSNEGTQVLTVRLPQAKVVNLGVWFSPNQTPPPRELTPLDRW